MSSIVEPGGEAVAAVLDLRRQRIVAEEIADLGDGGIDRAHILVLADIDDVALRQQEDLSLELLDERFERVAGDTDLMRAAIVGPKPREMHHHGAPPVRRSLQAVDIVEQQLLDA